MFIKIWIFASLNQNQDAYFISGGIWMPQVHAVCSVLIHGDVSINHVFCENTERGMCCLADNRRNLAWHDDLIDEHSCSDQWANAYFEALCCLEKKKKKEPLQKICLCNRGDFTSGLPRGKPKIYKSAKEQMNPSWPREIFKCLWGFSTAASLSFPYFDHIIPPSSLAIEALGGWVWPSEVRGHLFYTWTR